MNRKIDKDELHSIIQKEDHKIQTVLKQIQAISEFLKQTLGTLIHRQKRKLNKEINETANQKMNNDISDYNQFQVILNKLQDYDHDKFFLNEIKDSIK